MNEGDFDPPSIFSTTKSVQVLEDPVSNNQTPSLAEVIFRRIQYRVDESQVQPSKLGKVAPLRPPVCFFCNKREDGTPNSNNSETPQTPPVLDGYRFECSQCASFSKPTMLEQGIPQTELRKGSTNHQKIRRLTNHSSHLPQEHSPNTPQNDTGNVLQSRPYDDFANKSQEPRNAFQASIDRPHPEKQQGPRAPSKPKLPKLPKAPKPPSIEKPQKEPPVPLVFKHTKWEEMIQSLKSDVIVHAQYVPVHKT